MESADKTAEHLEMAAVKAGNHTPAADDIDWLVSQLDCLCQWQFLNDVPMCPDCLDGIVACEIGHVEEPYLLSSVEICSSTCSMNQQGRKPLQMPEAMWNISEYG